MIKSKINYNVKSSLSKLVSLRTPEGGEAIFLSSKRLLRRFAPRNDTLLVFQNSPLDDNGGHNLDTSGCLSFGFCYLFVIWILLFVIYGNGYAQGVSSSELITKAKEYDGKTVVYAGEVIGDVMRRGNYAWLNVSDGKNAIGIWAPAGLIQDITLAGNYKTKGDMVEVSGEFSRSCPEHGGDLDIHALSLRKAASGRAQVEKMNPEKKNQAFILLGVLIAVWILSKFLRR